MMEKFQQKYRIPSARARWWNYGNDAAYFITICTAQKEHYFGEILDNTTVLSELGQIVEKEWLKTISLRSDMNLQMGEFVVMPNHFHAIIVIGKNIFNIEKHFHSDAQLDNINNCNTQQCRDAMHSRDAMHCVSTYANKFGPQSKNLSSIIRGFKSSVKTYARKIHCDFEWQSRFHDHIIRDESEYIRISDYIINNPINWKEDKFYTE